MERAWGPTVGHLAIQEKFKFGILYGKEVMQDLAKKALYDVVRRSNQSAYGLAIRDSFKAPKILSIMEY